MYDTVIKNVRIIDGTSAPWFRGWVGIRNGVIARVGTGVPETGADTVDGEDNCLAPGFIDIHSHSDTSLPSCPSAESRILQGITTEIGGDCGLSAAPVSPDPQKKKQLSDYVGEMDYSWDSMGGYLDYMEKIKPSVNFGTAVGHGTVRLAAMGFEARRATETELEIMKGLLRQSLAEGGLS